MATNAPSAVWRTSSSTIVAPHSRGPGGSVWGAEDLWNTAAIIHGVPPKWILEGDRLVHRVETEQYRAALAWNAELFDRQCIALVRDTAKRLGLASLDLPSQAGHDAYHVARVAPTAMIFSPCKDGITHNNKESCVPNDFRAGLNILLHAAVQRADREADGAAA